MEQASSRSVHHPRTTWTYAYLSTTYSLIMSWWRPRERWFLLLAGWLCHVAVLSVGNGWHVAENKYGQSAVYWSIGNSARLEPEVRCQLVVQSVTLRSSSPAVPKAYLFGDWDSCNFRIKMAIGSLSRGNVVIIIRHLEDLNLY